MDIRGPQTGGECGVFEALEQTLVKLLVGFKLVLEDIVLDKKLIEPSQFRLLPADGLGEELLLVLGGYILVVVALHDALPFRIDVCPDFVRLG